MALQPRRRRALSLAQGGVLPRLQGGEVTLQAVQRVALGVEAPRQVVVALPAAGDGREVGLQGVAAPAQLFICLLNLFIKAIDF